MAYLKPRPGPGSYLVLGFFCVLVAVVVGWAFLVGLVLVLLHDLTAYLWRKHRERSQRQDRR